MYRVFIRRWWREWEPRDAADGFRPGDLVPHPRARKTTLTWVGTREEAIRVAEDYNRTHKPGKYSLKAEWTQE